MLSLEPPVRKTKSEPHSLSNREASRESASLTATMSFQEVVAELEGLQTQLREARMRDVEVTAEMKWIEVGEKAHSGVV